jgi:hypothetical protein
VFDRIIDPTIGPAAGPGPGRVVLAERPASLSGLRLGLLANTKRNAEEFLDQVGKLLAARYRVRTVLAARKPDITNTAPEPILAELRAGCDIVVTGVGDCGSCSASAVADGLLLEQAGVPAVVICSDAFTVSADAMAGLRGAAGYRYVTTPHPVASLTPDGVRERARQAIPPIVALLTQPAMAASL